MSDIFRAETTEYTELTTRRVNQHRVTVEVVPYLGCRLELDSQPLTLDMGSQKALGYGRTLSVRAIRRLAGAFYTTIIS